MVGGDYLSYFKLPNGNILFILADVSGKGIPAALLVSSINSVLFILTETGKNLCDLASMLSRSVYYTSTPTKYATAFFAEINPETLKITYINAGHNPPLLIGKEVRNVDLSEGGFCIGMFDKASYKCGEIEINKDEVLVIYTDGITEQINSREEFFGEERTKKIIEKSLNKSPSEINRAILDSVSAFADTDYMMDDMTLLTIKRCS
jgi:sigma-B regulation protein RsbU (phosphoserine phosphatase)